MLAVINDELRVHWHFKDAKTVVAGERLEDHFGVNRSGNGGEDVVAGVIQDVARHLWDAGFVQHALGPQFGRKLLLVENRNLP